MNQLTGRKNATAKKPVKGQPQTSDFPELVEIEKENSLSSVQKTLKLQIILNKEFSQEIREIKQELAELKDLLINPRPMVVKTSKYLSVNLSKPHNK